jgi:hypothetical protein
MMSFSSFVHLFLLIFGEEEIFCVADTAGIRTLKGDDRLWTSVIDDLWLPIFLNRQK